MSLKNSIILFGGQSEERLVSVASAQNLALKLEVHAFWFLDQKLKVYNISKEELLAHPNAFTEQFVPKVSPLTQNLSEALPLMKGKNIILSMHGDEGENGTLQDFFGQNNIAYTGSNPEASRLAFDKKATKNVLEKEKIPVALDITLSSIDASFEKQVRDFSKKFDHHIVVKPTASGSSVGLFIIHSEEDLNLCLKKIKSGSATTYIAENFLEGRELTIGVWQSPQGITALPASEVVVQKGKNFDYLGKYLGDGVKELTPAPLDPPVAKQCQDLAVKVHLAIGCEGYTRTDMILTKSGPIVLEINTLPGLSKSSFIPQQLACINVSLKDFFEQQVKLANIRLKKMGIN